jgi:hypothetical protein
MPFHEEADDLDENHRGETLHQIESEDWVDRLIAAWEREQNQMEPDYEHHIPNSVKHAMERALTKTHRAEWKLSHYHDHRRRQNQTFGTHECLIQHITDAVCRQLIT